MPRSPCRRRWTDLDDKLLTDACLHLVYSSDEGESDKGDDAVEYSGSAASLASFPKRTTSRGSSAHHLRSKPRSSSTFSGYASRLSPSDSSTLSSFDSSSMSIQMCDSWSSQTTPTMELVEEELDTATTSAQSSDDTPGRSIQGSDEASTQDSRVPEWLKKEREKYLPKAEKADSNEKCSSPDTNHLPSWYGFGIPRVFPTLLPTTMTESKMEHVFDMAVEEYFGPCVYGFLQTTRQDCVELRRMLVLYFPELRVRYAGQSHTSAYHPIAPGERENRCLYFYEYNWLKATNGLQKLHEILMGRRFYSESPFSWCNLGCRGEEGKNSRTLSRDEFIKKLEDAQGQDVLTQPWELKPRLRTWQDLEYRPEMPPKPTLEIPTPPSSGGFFFVITSFVSRPKAKKKKKEINTFESYWETH